MKKHVTIPCEEGAKRFEYYFRPNDYIHNMNKVMDFERENNDSACAEKHGFPKPRIGRRGDADFDLHLMSSPREENDEPETIDGRV
jgi:hypothetical protein